jgi:hypothetical protein
LRTDRRFARSFTAGLAGLLAAGALAAAPALAQNRIMCSQPVEPTCVNSEITYEDPQRIDRCRRDVENYSQSVEDYLSCLEQKATAQEEALKELRETFRCNADDDVEC